MATVKNFDKAYANKVSKDQWVKEHLAHGDEAELSAIYDELQAEKPKEAKNKESK